MKYISRSNFFTRTLAGAPHQHAERHAVDHRIGVRRVGRFWSAIAAPFHKSIHVRFQYAFGFAFLGLILMAAITIISGRYLLNTYESSVLEMRLEMAPIEQLQKSLREADNLVLRYAIESDQSAPMRFNEVEAEVNTQLQILAEIEAQFALLNDSHHELFVPEIRRMWQDEKAMVKDVARRKGHGAGCIRALSRLAGSHQIFGARTHSDGSRT